jgi:hypothetical protein
MLTGWRLESSSAHRKAPQSGAFRVMTVYASAVASTGDNTRGNIPQPSEAPRQARR